MYARARQTGTQDLSIFIDPGGEVKVFTFAWVTPFLHVLATVATRHPIVGSMAFYELLKMLWEPGFDLLYAPGTVPAAFSETRFQVKKSACFWRPGRYQEW